MVLLGRSATKRAATDSDSEAVAGSSETAATNDLILSVAASVGSRARFAASPQGSRSSRASAESTVSNIPFFS